MNESFIKNKIIYAIPIVIFIIFAMSWIYIQRFDVESVKELRQLWGHTYLVLSVFGGVVGLFISQKWGGYKSLLGKIILVLSIGLLFQSFGQICSSYYVYINDVESPPYPAIGDIGFFGSVIIYIYGVILLIKLSGFNFSIKKINNKIWAFVIPIFMILLSYFIFLKGYEFDFANKIKIILDFGYPLGQAFYVSVAILFLILSRNILGGVLKKSVLFLVFALIFQAVSDFVFLYQVNSGSWYIGGLNDFMYMFSYFLMTISLIQLGSEFYKIKEAN